jgi:hypothetical protein
MPRSVKARLVLLVIFVMLLALVVAGCGDGGDNGGDGGTDPATVIPPKTPVYIEVTTRPEGETKANIEALAQAIAGVDDLGVLLETKLEESAEDDGAEIDFDKDIRPWLGREAGIFLPEYKEEDFDGAGLVVQVTDTREAEEFVDERAVSNGEPAEDGSYEGVDFKVQRDDGTTIGVVDDLLVLAKSEALFKQVVDTAEGESLADDARFTDAVSNLPDDSAVDLYVDIGGLIKQSDGEIDPEAKAFFDAAGFEFKKTTMVASAIPGSNYLEIDFSANINRNELPTGHSSDLLAELPGDSVAALVVPEFGERFKEGLDQYDKTGIPGEVPPQQLKKYLKKAGIDLELISSSIGDAGLFVEGTSERDLEAALVLDADDATQATNTVSNLGLFLRASGTPGVKQLTGKKVTGFMISSPELGSKPLLVAAKGSRITISYGTRAEIIGLDGADETLAGNPRFKEALSAFGAAPMTAFVDGPSTLDLVSGLVPPNEEGFLEVKPYLAKIGYLALGSEATDGLPLAKLIIGLGR